MTREEVIEKMAEVISYSVILKLDTDIIAQNLLDLRYPCGDCEGKGERDNYGSLVKSMCPTCKGKGHLGKVLAVLAENQELPKMGILGDVVKEPVWFIEGYLEAQQDMITPKDGYVWKKVRE